jgi:hypothetical protein
MAHLGITPDQGLQCDMEGSGALSSGPEPPWVTPARRVAALLHNGHLQARRPFRMVFTSQVSIPLA